MTTQQHTLAALADENEQASSSGNNPQPIRLWK